MLENGKCLHFLGSNWASASFVTATIFRFDSARFLAQGDAFTTPFPKISSNCSREGNRGSFTPMASSSSSVNNIGNWALLVEGVLDMLFGVRLFGFGLMASVRRDDLSSPSCLSRRFGDFISTSSTYVWLMLFCALSFDNLSRKSGSEGFFFLEGDFSSSSFKTDFFFDRGEDGSFSLRGEEIIKELSPFVSSSFCCLYDSDDLARSHFDLSIGRSFSISLLQASFSVNNTSEPTVTSSEDDIPSIVVGCNASTPMILGFIVGRAPTHSPANRPKVLLRRFEENCPFPSRRAGR